MTLSLILSHWRGLTHVKEAGRVRRAAIQRRRAGTHLKRKKNSGAPSRIMKTRDAVVEEKDSPHCDCESPFLSVGISNDHNQHCPEKDDKGVTDCSSHKAETPKHVERLLVHHGAAKGGKEMQVTTVPAVVDLQ